MCVCVCFGGLLGCGEAVVRTTSTNLGNNSLHDHLPGAKLSGVQGCVYVCVFLLVHADLAVSEISAGADAHTGTFTKLLWLHELCPFFVTLFCPSWKRYITQAAKLPLGFNNLQLASFPVIVFFLKDGFLFYFCLWWFFLCQKKYFFRLNH